MNTPEARADAEHLCASVELADGGQALVFDVLQYGQPIRAFALRFEGQVVAYLNRCVHVPTEMDWQPGEFLDSDKRFILCSTHGAAYEPIGRALCRRALWPRAFDGSGGGRTRRSGVLVSFP